MNFFWWISLAKKGSTSLTPGSSCKDILISGDAQGDGKYRMDPAVSGDPFIVFCDMTTAGGKSWSLENDLNVYVCVCAFFPQTFMIVPPTNKYFHCFEKYFYQAFSPD